MKVTNDSLKGLAGNASVRVVGATAVVVPLASVAGALSLNHNETLLRDEASEGDHEGPARRRKVEQMREAAATSSLRAVAPVAGLVPVAALLGAMTYNHSETFLRDGLG